MTITHYDSDAGAIVNAMSSVFGQFYVPHKTAKTLCGARMVISRINNDAPTCPKCLAQYKADQDAIAKDKVEMRQWLKDNPSYNVGILAKYYSEKE